MPLSTIESKSDFGKIVFRNQGQSHCRPVSRHFENYRSNIYEKSLKNHLQQAVSLIGWFLVDWFVGLLVCWLAA